MGKKKILLVVGAIIAVIIAATVAIVVILGNGSQPSPGEAAVKSLDYVLELPKTIIPNEETPPMLTLIEERNGYELLWQCTTLMVLMDTAYLNLTEADIV